MEERKPLKTLNLYAGIGGNRKLWTNVDVTAIELNPDIAKIYQDFFPDDKVIIADAHQYLLEHYEDGWNFIWSSPPCPSHSRIRNVAGVGNKQNKAIYPDMNLWAEIIFLNQIYHSSGCNFNGKYSVENVVTYYQPLIRPQVIGRHYFWANFLIPRFRAKTRGHMLKISELETLKGIKSNDAPYRKDTFLRNATEPELGLHIFNSMNNQELKLAL